MADREPIKWVTVNGKHIPIYADEGAGSFSEAKYKNINSGYNADKSIYDKSGRNNNCVKCALAFEANMRGEDTEAYPFEFGNPDDSDKSKSIWKAFGLKQGDAWEVGRSNRADTIEQIEFLMNDFGPGSRAILQTWTASQKHAFNVINDNGKLIYIDPLTGEAGDAKKIMKGINTKSLNLLRTDDQEMSKEYQEWAYKKRS